jgi:hypothetical protein
MLRREIPPLRDPTRSQEANAKKKRRLAPVGGVGLGVPNFGTLREEWVLCMLFT